MKADRIAARRAAEQHGVLTRAQARAAGLSDDEIRGRLTAGHWERLHQGVYRVSGSRAGSEQTIMAAILAAGSGAVASHVTAALIHCLPAGGSGIHLTVQAARRPRVDGVVIHRVASLERVDWLFKQGLPVTSVARTLVDLAGELRPERLEEVLDHALAARMVGLRQVRQCLKGLGVNGRRGAAVLAQLVALRLEGSPRPRERGERLLERILAEHGLPPGEREFEITLPDGRVRRPDRAFPEARLAVQVDSYRHHSSLTDWSADLTRDNDLVEIGWGTLVFTYRDLKARPSYVARKIADTLRRAAADAETSGPTSAPGG